MTALEKAEIYRFLTTTHAWVSGYRNKEIEPKFSDSPVGIQRIPVLVVGRKLSSNAQILLNKMLTAIDLDPSKNCIITDVESLNTQSLEEQIQKYNPYAILVLGKDFEIDFQNDCTFTHYNGILLLAIENPEDILHKPELKRPAWEALKLFKAQLNRLLAGDI